MTYLYHFILFFIVAGAWYGIALDRGRELNWPSAVALLGPIVGVYFLGWWALLTCAIGFLAGGKAYRTAMLRAEEERRSGKL